MVYLSDIAKRKKSEKMFLKVVGYRDDVLPNWAKDKSNSWFSKKEVLTFSDYRA